MLIFLYHRLKRDFELTLSKVQETLANLLEPLISIKERVSDLSSIKQDISKILVTEEIIRRMDQDISSLSRIFLSRKAGKAGERGLEELLEVFPPHLVVKNLRLGAYEVEFAIKLPYGRYLPIDSKVAGIELLQRESLTKEEERELVKNLIKRVRELSDYVKDEKTIGMALMVVPDRAYEFLRVRALHEMEREKVIVISYGLVIPVISFFIYLWDRFGKILDEKVWAEVVCRIEKFLNEVERDIEQLSRELKSVENLYLKIRTNFINLRRELERLKED